MSAVRLSFGQENFHIFNRDCEKHFLYVRLATVKVARHYKFRNIFPNEQHSGGALFGRVQKKATFRVAFLLFLFV